MCVGGGGGGGGGCEKYTENKINVQGPFVKSQNLTLKISFKKTFFFNVIIGLAL